MRTNRAYLPVAAFAAVVLLAGVRGLPQDRPPAEKKPGGLLGALRGSDDPTKDPRRAEPEPAPEVRKPSPVVNAAPDPQRLAERIRRLESVGYNDVKPVDSLAEARERIGCLRRRAERVRAVGDRKTVEMIRYLDKRTGAVRGKWQALLDTMGDGKKRSPQEWAELSRRVRETSTLPADMKRPTVLDDPQAAADDEWGLPTEDELATDEARPAAPAGEADPMAPVKEPRSADEIRQPDLSDMAKAIARQEKPDTMHPLTWARLVDAFEADVAELEASTAATRRQLAEQRRSAFEPAARALQAAQRTYKRIRDFGKPPPEWMRRQMAWRLHQADLAQLRLAHEAAEALAKERKGERGKREPMISQDPLAPEKALADLARLMHVDGMPGAPKPDAFDDIQPEGLPPLYPSGVEKELDTHVNYGHLVQANIDRYQSRLRGLRRQIADAEKTVAEADAAERRAKWAELTELDRLDGRADHPVAVARRRVALKEMYRDQLKARPERVAKRKAALEAEVAETVKALEAEYARRDRTPKDKPEPGED